MFGGLGRNGFANPCEWSCVSFVQKVRRFQIICTVQCAVSYDDVDNKADK